VGLENLLTFAPMASRRHTSTVLPPDSGTRPACGVQCRQGPWVANEPQLNSRARVLVNKHCRGRDQQRLKVISAEAYSKHGVNAHA
jgi:hypothetical protein